MDSSIRRKETLKVLLIVWAGSILTGNTLVGLFGALIYVLSWDIQSHLINQRSK